jgi:hypothetical protein
MAGRDIYTFIRDQEQLNTTLGPLAGIEPASLVYKD